MLAETTLDLTCLGYRHMCYLWLRQECIDIWCFLFLRFCLLSGLTGLNSDTIEFLWQLQRYIYLCLLKLKHFNMPGSSGMGYMWGYFQLRGKSRLWQEEGTRGDYWRWSNCRMNWWEKVWRIEYWKWFVIIFFIFIRFRVFILLLLLNQRRTGLGIW